MNIAASHGSGFGPGGIAPHEARSRVRLIHPFCRPASAPSLRAASAAHLRGAARPQLPRIQRVFISRP